MMADRSLLRSGSETWGPVSPDNVHETGVWPIGPRAFPVVAVEAGQVERTRRKTWSRLDPSFCALQAPRHPLGTRNEGGSVEGTSSAGLFTRTGGPHDPDRSS
jgi:hypothetical protein